jgi:hypothetical protein
VTGAIEMMGRFLVDTMEVRFDLRRRNDEVNDYSKPNANFSKSLEKRRRKDLQKEEEKHNQEYECPWSF